MPRSGWLALGGVLAAAGIPAVAAGREVAITAALAAVALLLIWFGTRSRPGTVVASIAVGAVMVALRMSVAPADPGDLVPPSGRGPWEMVVQSVGSPREGMQVATLQLVESQAAGGGVRLAASLPRYPLIEPGDVVQVGGRLRERPDSAYGRYLERIGAWGTLQADRLQVARKPDGPAQRLEGWRRDSGDSLAAVLPEPEAGLAAGILIGLRDRVDRDVAAAFTTAGVSHVVAISGWNIAIVAAAVATIAGRLGRRRRAVVTALAIVLYIVFAGASPSVLRAGAMAGVVLIARESGRAGRAAAALGWAALLLLLADPSLVGDAGFQLSTIATAGLIAWATPTTNRIDRLTRGRLPRWLVESLGVSLAAQSATLPIVLASFGRLSLIAPAINLLVVPLVTPVMAAGLLALGGGLLVGLGFPGVVGSVLAAPAWVGLRLMIALVNGAAAVPYASLEVEPPIGAAMAVALVAGVGGAMVVRRRRPARQTSRAPALGGPTPAAAPRATEAPRADRYAVMAL
ncbi:MAG: ComEC/Rec2 family competence protein, partial [Candidatus Limnocylindrales bacterium]